MSYELQFARYGHCSYWLGRRNLKPAREFSFTFQLHGAINKSCVHTANSTLSIDVLTQSHQQREDVHDTCFVTPAEVQQQYIELFGEKNTLLGNHFCPLVFEGWKTKFRRGVLDNNTKQMATRLLKIYISIVHRRRSSRRQIQKIKIKCIMRTKNK